MTKTRNVQRLNFGSLSEEETIQAVEDGLALVTDDAAIGIILRHCRTHEDPLSFLGELLANLDSLNEDLGG